MHASPAYMLRHAIYSPQYFSTNFQSFPNTLNSRDCKQLLQKDTMTGNPEQQQATNRSRTAAPKPEGDTWLLVDSLPKINQKYKDMNNHQRRKNSRNYT